MTANQVPRRALQPAGTAAGPRGRHRWTGSRFADCAPAVTTAYTNMSAATVRTSSWTPRSALTPGPPRPPMTCHVRSTTAAWPRGWPASSRAEPVQLIETLAQRLAEACLAEPAVTEVEITVHKPQAPVRVPLDDVAVTISRRRA